MTEKKIALISDIHGNSEALRTVLADIEKRSINTVVNLGDSLYGPLDPVGTFDLLHQNKILSISGNQDRFILENLKDKTNIQTLEYVKDQLADEANNWLDSLPFDTVVNDMVYCCHASPLSDSEYLLEKLNKGFVSIKEKSDVESLLHNTSKSIIACGHSHVSRVFNTETKLIVNPGSVGIPAYDDDLPVYHKMENFNPRACYAVLELMDNSVAVERVSVEYDFEKAAKQAEANNRTDWAKWIRTGMA